MLIFLSGENRFLLWVALLGALAVVTVLVIPKLSRIIKIPVILVGLLMIGTTVPSVGATETSHAGAASATQLWMLRSSKLERVPYQAIQSVKVHGVCELWCEYFYDIQVDGGQMIRLSCTASDDEIMAGKAPALAQIIAKGAQLNGPVVSRKYGLPELTWQR